MYGNSVGKAAEKWNDWESEEQKRRDEGYQQQMLHHMSAEKCVSETIERRGDREPDGSETKKKGGQPPSWEEVGARFANSEPTTGIDNSGEDDRGGKEERR